MLTPELHRQVKRINIRARRIVDGAFAGQYLSVFKGQGIEFFEVRDYAPGDDVRQIDWNVTARMNRPFVKRQIEERELTVMLLVDLSRSMRFSSHGKTKLRIATEIAAVLSQSALRAHDRVGMILFTDRIERLVAPRGGRHRTARLIAELMGTDPQGQGTDIGLPLDRLDHAITRRTVCFLISDMYGPEFRRAARRAHRRHEIVPIWLRDPAETELPDVGMIWLDDMETGERVLVDTSDARVAAAFRDRQEEAAARRRRTFRELGIDAVEIRTDQPYMPPLLEHLQRIARQRRRP